MKSAKSFGFCFKQGKEKTKQKAFAMCMGESKRQFAPVLFIGTVLNFIRTNFE
jgi:ribosomal protein S12 methylthiotransferase accessory factor YcaO